MSALSIESLTKDSIYIASPILAAFTARATGGEIAGDDEAVLSGVALGDMGGYPADVCAKFIVYTHFLVFNAQFIVIYKIPRF